jgi:hypothetical protein
MEAAQMSVFMVFIPLARSIGGADVVPPRFAAKERDRIAMRKPPKKALRKP